MGKLRDQMLVDLQLRGATPRTQKTYLREVSNFAKYFNRSPKELGEGELKEYMLYLMKQQVGEKNSHGGCPFSELFK